MRNEYYRDLPLLEKYVHAMSLITETISKVGYGISITPLEPIEMLFLMYLIIFNYNTIFVIFYQIKQLQESQPLKNFIKSHQDKVEQFIS